MKLQIRRRQFGKLVLASAATTAIINLANKSVAQNSNTVVYGAIVAAKGRKQAKDQESTDVANTTPAIKVTALDLGTLRQVSTTEVPSTAVDNANTVTESAQKALYTEPTERITGFTSLSDGSFVFVVVGSSRKGNYTKLLITDIKKLDKKPKSKKISGFKKTNNTIEGVVGTKDDKLICIVSESGGTPPFKFALVDPQNGKVSYESDLALPELFPNRRYSNLAQSPIDGKYYLTTMNSEGITQLAQLDLDNKSIITGKGKIIELSPLTFDRQALANDLFSLAFSPSGDLYAVGKLKSEQTKYLFNVDLKNAQMKRLTEFSVDKIAFARS
ncbi:hypothetical protein CEN41_18935 [Fischerella thermalis CCMEE 5330]|uniref:Uncharacterized protein n=1 Tax=Fischerella thermalis CCMEE 5330 TaxID=2019670 RepID=A0A2N6M1S2_9CYAN|nr:hypothetical protein [Fischerella thermalis]PMB40695.1 hypothetical protein CEN41_18935 [Fischerella thermalis CCMEE 5330]